MCVCVSRAQLWCQWHWHRRNVDWTCAARRTTAVIRTSSHDISDLQRVTGTNRAMENAGRDIVNMNACSHKTHTHTHTEAARAANASIQADQYLSCTCSKPYHICNNFSIKSFCICIKLNLSELMFVTASHWKWMNSCFFTEQAFILHLLRQTNTEGSLAGDVTVIVPLLCLSDWPHSTDDATIHITPSSWPCAL